jgi:calcium-dependent protein kinase
LVLLDFGMACELGDTQSIKGTVQSKFYYSPETLEYPRVAGQRRPRKIRTGEMWRAADMWSVGVVIYLLLVGNLPFDSDDDRLANIRLTNEAILASRFEWRDDIQPVSAQAKDLVNRLLVADYKERLTARQALEHPWLNGEATEVVKSATAVAHLVSFAKKERFHLNQHVAEVMLHQISLEERQVIADTFALYDKDNDGSLDRSEIHSMLVALGQPTDEDTKRVLSFLDNDDNGAVTEEEFAAATLAARLSTASELEMKELFVLADKNNNGRLCLAELSELFPHLAARKVQQIFNHADKDGSGEICFEEWVGALQAN